MSELIISNVFFPNGLTAVRDSTGCACNVQSQFGYSVLVCTVMPSPIQYPAAYITSPPSSPSPYFISTPCNSRVSGTIYFITFCYINSGEKISLNKRSTCIAFSKCGGGCNAIAIDYTCDVTQTLAILELNTVVTFVCSKKSLLLSNKSLRRSGGGGGEGLSIISWSV